VALNLKISFPLLITTKVCENKNKKKITVVRFGRRHDTMTVFKICTHDIIRQEFYAHGATVLPLPLPPLPETENGFSRLG